MIHKRRIKNRLTNDYSFKIAERNKHEDHIVIFSFFNSIPIVVALSTH